MNSETRRLVKFGAAAAVLSLGAFIPSVIASETCVPQWHTAIGQPGLVTTVHASTGYNGDLIAGGTFATAGGQVVNNIARWDGSQWHPLTSGGEIGVASSVYTLTVYNGDLIAGGIFVTAGGQTVNNIARWNGEEWDRITSGGEIGTSGNVHSLGVYNGDLIAGGRFETAGGQTVNNIARWDGEAWHPLSSGGQIGVDAEFPNVNALSVYNGDLIAGGGFTTAGGMLVNHIARWDGTQWYRFTSGGQIGVNVLINALTLYNGDLIAGGNFTTAGGQTVNRIAGWDGEDWYRFTSGGQIGVSGEAPSVVDLTVYNGDLIASGWFTDAGGQTVNRITRWDGGAWHPFTSGGQIGVFGYINALTPYNGDLIAGGGFSTAGGQPASAIAAWRDCLPQRGACCINGAAVQLYEGECIAVGGVFLGEGVPSDEATCTSTCTADLNSDGVVNVSDLLLLLSDWGMCP